MKVAASASRRRSRPTGTGTGDIPRQQRAGVRRGRAREGADPQFKAQCEAERQEVLAAGGLKIIGTERHESRRIDNQLRGRAGRQGDPGASRFYLSLQDDLLRIFGLDRMTGLMERLGLEDHTPIESGMVTRSIENAQKKVEGRNFDQRKNVLEYDDVMNMQRKTIYALRRQVLEGRYQPQVSEEDAKRGKEPPPPVSESGDWSVQGLVPEIRPKLAELIEAVHARAAQVEADRALGSPADPRPGWRILRGEVWRQYGTLIDVEKRFDGDRSKLVDYVAETVASSMVQQRERIHELADTRVGDLCTQHLSTEVNEDDWDYDALEDALQEQFGIEFELQPARSTRSSARCGPRSRSACWRASTSCRGRGSCTSRATSTSRRSTPSGSSTSRPWTRCARASACRATARRTRRRNTSASATTCSPR
jgi:hypothetical protein